jgi:branched-chain amino acid transport system ATP-binding protein
MALLALHAVSKAYGALKVTDGISLAVTEGETLGILGPNGAGKTTLFNLISGDVRVDAGRVEYAGRDVTRLKPHQRCHAGIGRSYQVPQPFGKHERVREPRDGCLLWWAADRARGLAHCP